MKLEDLLNKVAKEYCFGSQNWWIENVKNLPKNEWFSPSNSNDESFTICTEIHYHGWCSKKIEPLWSNGSYQGNKIYFFIKIEDAA